MSLERLKPKCNNKFSSEDRLKLLQEQEVASHPQLAQRHCLLCAHLARSLGTARVQCLLEELTSL
jgi:hypothetical protein